MAFFQGKGEEKKAPISSVETYVWGENQTVWIKATIKGERGDYDITFWTNPENKLHGASVGESILEEDFENNRASTRPIKLNWHLSKSENFLLEVDPFGGGGSYYEKIVNLSFQGVEERTTPVVESRISIENGVSVHISAKEGNMELGKWYSIRFLRLLDPKGEVAARKGFETSHWLRVKGKDSFEKYLSLGSLDPEPGSYTFQFLDKDKEVLFENEITYTGQNVLIEDIGKLHSTKVTEEYFLDNVKITVTNNWNFKIEAGLDVTVGKEFYWSSEKSHLIQPGQSKEMIFQLDAPITETVEPGSYNVRYEVVASRYEWAEGGTVVRRFENIKFCP